MLRRFATRLRFPHVAALSVGLLSSTAASAQTVRITDLKGRVVTLDRPATSVLIDDGRYLIALGLIHTDPVTLLAGWPHDVNRLGQPVYEKYREKSPRLATLPKVASSAEAFSLEQALAVKPSVAVFSLGQGPSDEQLRQFEAAKIPVVFIDFFTRPLANQERSLVVLGQLVGRQAQAEAFVAYRRSRLQVIADRLKKVAPAAPKVFLEAHAGMSADCCNSPGKGNVGDYIGLVGGHNIGADVLPGAFGPLNLEYVLSQNPTVYIATGGPHLERAGGFIVGPGYSVDRSRESLQKMASRPGIAQLAAVKTGRVFGLSHQLLNSPLDLVTIEALARWIHPTLFGDLDPARTLGEINSKFLAVPIEGPLWISLR